MKQLFLAVIAVLFTGAVEIGVAREPGSHTEPSGRPLQSASGEYELLVDALYNNNPKPTIVGEGLGEPIFPENYDWREQDRIRELIKQLLIGIDDAWPVLVAHLDDERYCFTCDQNGWVFNYTIRTVCWHLLQDNIPWPAAQFSPNVFAYRRLRRPLGLPEEALELKKWCSEKINAGKSLSEVQLEVCEWALATLPLMPKMEMNEEEKQTAKTGISKAMQELQMTKKAIRQRTFFGEQRGMYSAEHAASIRQRLSREGKLPK